MEIETERLLLRPWTDDDAEACFKYAKDTDVGPRAGWPPHTSVENSREIIRTVFSAPEVYAVVLKRSGEPIGCCGFSSCHAGLLGHDEAEIGYWLGKPYWGRGLIPEAVNAVAERCFLALGMKALWIALFDGNDQSRRVAEKCGFSYDHTCSDDSGQVEHFYRLSSAGL